MELSELSISQLRNLYRYSNSLEVVEFVRKTKGLSGLLHLDVSIAIGSVSLLLESNQSAINMEVNMAKSHELDILLKLIYEIYKDLNANTNQYEDESDRYTNILYVMSSINIYRRSDIGDKDQMLVRSFIVSMLHLAKELGDIYLTDMCEAISLNLDITEEDVFTWLNTSGEFVKYYVSNIQNILKYKMENTHNSFVKSATNYDEPLDYSTTILLLYRYYNYLLENFTEEDVERELSDVIYSIIDIIYMNETPGIDDRKSMAHLFIDSSYSDLHKISPAVSRIITLWWSIFLYYVRDIISEKYEIKSEITYYYPETINMFYDWRRQIVNYTFNGLIYTLFYRDIYDKDDIIYLDDDIKHKAIDQEFSDSKDRMISKGLLMEEYFSQPERYLQEYAPTLFPSVQYFKDKESGIKTANIPEEEVEETLDALGL